MLTALFQTPECRARARLPQVMAPNPHPAGALFCKRGCAGPGPWLFATTFLMRLTTHDKLSYMETKSRFDGIYVPQRCKPGVALQTKQHGVEYFFIVISAGSPAEDAAVGQVILFI